MPRGNLQRGEAALQVSDRTKLRKEEKNGKESNLAFNAFISLHANTSFQSRRPKRVSDRVRESTTRLREYQAHQTCAPSHGSTPGCFQLCSHPDPPERRATPKCHCFILLTPSSAFPASAIHSSCCCSCHTFPCAPCTSWCCCPDVEGARAMASSHRAPFHQQSPMVGSSCSRAASAALSRQGTIASWLVDKRKRSKIKISFQKSLPISSAANISAYVYSAPISAINPHAEGSQQYSSDQGGERVCPA